jgi:predicted polyphosphate/ATP-dependent NAD kinase
MARLGFIVNPVAGLGGRVGLKGSDGAAIQQKARALGAHPPAQQRALRALAPLRASHADLQLITYPAGMGEDVARAAGFTPEVIGELGPAPTTAADTRRAARQMQAVGVDLLLFVGGDGTARDVCEAIGEQLPVVGAPAGVKIHSAVYAISPEAAGWLALDFLQGRTRGFILAEVMDIDEEAFRRGEVQARLYGYLRTPAGPRWLQGMKAGSRPDEAAAQAAIAQEVIQQMQPGWRYVLGPGTTTRAIGRSLGVEKTLLGVDVIAHGQLLARDVTAHELNALTANYPHTQIIVTPIGGQGFIFGRGNQQIGPETLARVGKDGVLVVATREKIHRLQHRPLLVDSGDPEVDALFSGYISVITGLREAIIYPVRPA